MDKILGIQAIITTMCCSIFLLIVLMEKDELEQSALSNALKVGNVITILFFLGCGIINLLKGVQCINLNTIFIGVEIWVLTTAILFYLNIKGIIFELKIESERIRNILISLSIIISVFATGSLLFELDFFENRNGYIRYDEMILIVNVILVSMLAALLPKKKKIGHKKYKEYKKDLDRTFNILGFVYVFIMILVILFLIIQKFNVI